MKRLLIALALLLTFIAPVAVHPGSVSAACGAAARPLVYSGGWHDKGTITGCGTTTIQVCAQSYTTGTVYACVTWSGNTNNGLVSVLSGTLSTAYGCLQRTWKWDPTWGTQVSYYTNIC